MKASSVFLCAACASIWWAGCRSESPLQWRLLELGTTPITTAWERGQTVAAFTDERLWPGFIFPNDSSPQARIARRDAMTMPAIMCGDKMRLHPKDLPLGWVQQFDWSTRDSLTVSWKCLERAELAALGAGIVRASAQPEADEWIWLEALSQCDPVAFSAPNRRFVEDEMVRLAIACERPDGTALGDTVRLDFRYGELGQVIKALQPGLNRAGPGAHWTIWSPSYLAFGSHRHPELALEAHTPLKFSVTVE